MIPPLRGSLLRLRADKPRPPLPARSRSGVQSIMPKLTPGLGGAGTAACSGDMLLGALSACAQLTCQMVAAAMGIPTEHIEVAVEGDLDLRGTLGIARDVPVGFERIRIRFDIDAPKATSEQLRSLQEKTEQYCVVMQTLVQPPRLQSDWVNSR